MPSSFVAPRPDVDLTVASPALETLWQALADYEPPRPVHDHGSARGHELLDLPATIARLRRQLAFHYLRHHAMPVDRETLVQDLAQSPGWPAAVADMHRHLGYLLALDPAQFNWVNVEDALPAPGTEVIYFFDIVGTHAGYYEGASSEFGMPVFVGLFGGFLGGDVTHYHVLPAAAAS